MHKNSSRILEDTPESREALFQEIVRLYDLADHIMAAVEAQGLKNRNAQLVLATPLVTQITNSATILSAFYTEVVHNNRPVTAELQDTVEHAFRNIVLAFREFVDGVEDSLLAQKG